MKKLKKNLNERLCQIESYMGSILLWESKAQREWRWALGRIHRRHVIVSTAHDYQQRPAFLAHVYSI